MHLLDGLVVVVSVVELLQDCPFNVCRQFDISVFLLEGTCQQVQQRQQR